ncbi:phosphatase PAP2 family protein [Bacillus timonensis]|uniref:phosphatase PAP2 family protein n=1 Tax=Bacillus timonensis TaxID=1033734 RepID=UPI0002E46639|nr:phosphatase PAP2 family protein [Bacillus timonensis]
MNLKFQLSVAFTICLFSLSLFSLLSYFVHSHDIIRFDSRVISVVQGWESGWLTTLMKFLSFIGSAPVIIINSLILLFFLYKVLDHRRELILFIGVMVGSPILNFILKELFKRARPDFYRLVEISGYSFPSGHAVNAVTFYGILTFLLWRHIPVRWERMVLFVLSGMMILGIGLSRIYLGVHYPTDIVGGYFASATWLGFAIGAFHRFMERQALKYEGLKTG